MSGTRPELTGARAELHDWARDERLEPIRQLLASLAIAPGQEARINRSAKTLLSRYIHAARYLQQGRELSEAGGALAKVHELAVELRAWVGQMPGEARELLEGDLRRAEDNWTPAPIDHHGEPILTRLAQCYGEIELLASVTHAWSEEAAQAGRSGRPKDLMEAAVADSASYVYELLTGARPGRNVQGCEVASPFVQFLKALYRALDMDPKAAPWQARKALERRKATVGATMEKKGPKRRK